MDTDERLSALEQKLADYDALVERLVAFARTTPKGRVVLALLGVK